VKEACGVFGVYAPGRAVSHLTFDGLYSLQHRGQESAGMAVSDGGTITVMKDMGLVTAVFDERMLSGLPGHLAIGHTRYSTHGSSDWAAAQPVYRPVGRAGFALGHNGNLTNTGELLERTGMLPGMAPTDSDVVAELLARAFAGHPADATRDGVDDLRPALRDVVPRLEGAFSLVLLDAGHLYGVRDPHGFRPLCLGRLGPADDPTGWVLASETPALDVIGATLVRELEPGELVTIGDDGVRSESLFAPDQVQPTLCIFEFVYFARPDARLYGREVHGTRRRMGELLAAQAPVEADLVMGVPDSGVPAAEGYARASGIPYGQGLVKNRYIGRTFIAPDQQARVDAVRRKLNPLRDNIAGKRLVVVDDSIVRGTTTRSIVGMLRDAGAAEVHLRISSPPFRWPCFYGIDTPDRDELMAAHRSLADITAFLEADSVAYISIEHLRAAIDAPGAGFCDACLSGRYPVPVPVSAAGRLASGLAAATGVPGALRPDGDADGTGSGDGEPADALQAALPGV
jgi:amidophosphoribosyltransferase